MTGHVQAIVGRAIRRHRDAAGLTQSALVDRVGLSRASVANVEAGRQAVAVHHLYRIAAALGVEVRDLLRDLVPGT